MGREPKIVRMLFNDDMARAIVEGRKTVTRRPVISRTNGPVINDEHVRDQDGYSDGIERAVFQRGDELMGVAFPCATGDTLIGRECWRPVMESWRSFVEYSAGGELDVDGRALFVAERGIALRFPGAKKDVRTEKWHPSIHMPDWAARIRRRVVSVTVERLQDITEDDAVREGFGTSEELEEFFRNCAPPGSRMARPRDSFEAAWDSIYAAKGLGWGSNCWVWRIEFERENVQEVSNGR